MKLKVYNAEIAELKEEVIVRLRAEDDGSLILCRVNREGDLLGAGNILVLFTHKETGKLVFRKICAVGKNFAEIDFRGKILEVD